MFYKKSGGGEGCRPSGQDKENLDTTRYLTFIMLLSFIQVLNLTLCEITELEI